METVTWIPINLVRLMLLRLVPGYLFSTVARIDTSVTCQGAPWVFGSDDSKA
jgi:hypothetical protein